MIRNASITAITPPPTATKTGQPVYGTATACDERIFLGSPMRAQKLAVDERISTADAFAYVPLSSGLTIDTKTRLTIVLDQVSGAKTYTVQLVISRVLNGISHLELPLKELA